MIFLSPYARWMDSTAMLIAGLVALPGIGLNLWVNFVMSQGDDEMGCFDELVEDPSESRAPPSKTSRHLNITP